MQDWWDTITTFEKLFWYIAIPFTIILVIQLILVFAGMNEDQMEELPGIPDPSGFDAQTGDIGNALPIETYNENNQKLCSSGFNLFTIKNFIAFFAVFGWVAIALIQAGLSKLWIILISFGTGLLMMVILTFISCWIAKYKKSPSSST
jgi:hypothetical protein